MVFAIDPPSGHALSTMTALVSNSISSQNSKRAYERAIVEFLRWCRSSGAVDFTKGTLQAYRSALESRALSASTINVSLCAIRKLATELADSGALSQDAAASIGKVKGAKRKGVRIGNWLSAGQAEDLLLLPEADTVKGKRDRALLGILVGAGLRRSEAAGLTFAHLQQRDGRWIITDLVGKHGRIRSVPIPGWVKTSIDRWAEAAHLDDAYIFRPINKAGRLARNALTAQSIYHIVKHYSDQGGLDIAPHDLRRTFAKLARKGHAELEQIQLSLGHGSVTTTELYLGVRQNLNDAPCDHLGLHFERNSGM
jgi:site-specific recombinase XerD